MSDANNTRFTIVDENVGGGGTAGQTPTSPTWLPLRTLGSTLAPQNRVLESREIRSNRNPPGAKLGAPASGGSLPFELHFDSTGAFWELLKASIQTTTAAAAGSTVSSVAGDPAPTLTASGIAASLGCEIGDVLEITKTGVLQYRRVLSFTADEITYEGPVINTPGLTVKRGIRIKNGSTPKSWSMMESNYAPGGSSYARFEIFRGQSVDGFSLSAALEQITTGAFEIVGPGSAGLSTSDPSTGTPSYATAAPTTEVHDSGNNVPSILVSGVEYPCQTVSFQWRNGSKPRGVIGQRTPTGVGTGTFRGSGQITAYYDDIVEYNKALAGTASDLVFVSRDSTGKAYAFSMPAVRWGNPTRTNKTQDEQIVTNLPFTFETDAIENIGLRIMAYA